MRLYISLLLALCFTFNSFAAMNNPPTATEKQFLGWKNELSNPGFESGKVGWTVTTTAFTITTTSTEIAEGARAAEWNPAGVESLRSPGWAVPTNAGGNAVGFCRVRSNADADYDLEIYDGSGVVAEADIQASTTFINIPVNFVAVGGTTYHVQVTSAGDDDEIQVDSCGIGYAEGYNISNVSQAKLAGESYFAGTANCTGWTRTSTTMGVVATDADCPGPTVVHSNVGSWATTDADLPRQTVNNLPPGIYKAKFTFYNIASAGITGATVFDGSTSCEPQYISQSTAGAYIQQEAECTFTYTTAGNRVFDLYVGSSSGTITLYNAGTTPRISTKFTLEQWPLASQQAYTADKYANSWSGYHDNTCSWARTNTAFGAPTDDASCALVQETNTNFGTVSTSGSVSPAITFTPSKVQKYEVCAMPYFAAATSGAQVSIQMVDGAAVVLDDASFLVSGAGSGMRPTLCGFWTPSAAGSSQTFSLQTKASSGAVTIVTGSNVSSIRWRIMAIDDKIPAPQLVNSVVSSYQGVIRDESAFITDGSSTTTVSELGDWINGVCTNGSTGNYTCTFNSGHFSATPHCTAQPHTSDATEYLAVITSVSSSAISVRTVSFGAGSDADANFTLKCRGPK